MEKPPIEICSMNQNGSYAFIFCLRICDEAFTSHSKPSRAKHTIWPKCSWAVPIGPLQTHCVHIVLRCIHFLCSRSSYVNAYRRGHEHTWPDVHTLPVGDLSLHQEYLEAKSDRSLGPVARSYELLPGKNVFAFVLLESRIIWWKRDLLVIQRLKLPIK